MEKPLKNGAILVRLDQSEIAVLREFARQERMRTGQLVTATSVLRDMARTLVGLQESAQ